MNHISFVESYRRELDRIGLAEDTSPYGAISSANDEAVAQFLEHVRALPVGSTWRDIYPDIPTHWDLDDEETWTYPYRPLGLFDYQALPCGPALLIRLPLESTEADLAQMSADAAVKEWKVHGSGFVNIENPDWPDRLAYVVLDVATTEHQYNSFGEWLERSHSFSLAGWTRPVGTQFAPDEGT